MNRRETMMALVGAGALASIPSLAQAEPESPLRALYHEWQAVKDALNASGPGHGEEAEKALFRQLIGIEQQASDFTPRTVEDLAFKIVFADDDGDMERTVYQEALAKSAYAIAGLQPRDVCLCCETAV
ncbi:MAG: hypothetical protein ACK5IP_21600 [Paracoccus sp. (in: a-proteobacteria)]